MKFYVASQGRMKKRVQAVQDILIENGHEITFDWTREKDEGGEGIIRPDWRLHQAEGCAHAQRERDGVKEADVLVLILGESGFGPGSFIEFGIAAGVDKEIWVVGRKDWDRDSVFFCLPNVMHLDSDSHLADLAYLRRPDEQKSYPCTVHEDHLKEVPFSKIHEMFESSTTLSVTFILECGHRAIYPEPKIRSVTDALQFSIGSRVPCIWCAEDCHS